MSTPIKSPEGLRALAEFGRWCLDEMRHPAPGDIDGGSAQDRAQALGLLAEVTVTEWCCEGCACAEYHGDDDLPVDCMRETDLARALDAD